MSERVPGRPPTVRWLDAEAIGLDEDRIRVQQAIDLEDVLMLIDDLTELFVPIIEGGAVVTTNDQVAAAQVLESGLFGHVRSLRTAVVDGRIQDVLMLGRTIDEIRKRSVILLKRPDVARRLSSNGHLTMKELNDLYTDVLRREGTPHTEEQIARDSAMTDKQSWIIHGRHQGLQFQVIPAPDGGATVIRTPRSPHLIDRGRAAALYVTAIAAEAVQSLVPFLLTTFSIDRSEWDRRHTSFAQDLTNAIQTHQIVNYIRERLGDSAISVGLAGAVTRDGSVLSVDDVIALIERALQAKIP